MTDFHLNCIPPHAPNRVEAAALYTGFVFNARVAFANGRTEDAEILRQILPHVVEEHIALHPAHERLDWVRLSPFFSLYGGPK